jgi:hypothetical protein
MNATRATNICFVLGLCLALAGAIWVICVNPAVDAGQLAAQGWR